MKINDKHISQVLKNPNLIDKFIALQKEYANKNYAHKENFDKEILDISGKFTELMGQNARPYLMKKSALHIASKIKIDGSFHPRIFDKFENNMKGQIIIDQFTAYLYWRDSEKIRGMRIHTNPVTGYLGYESFCIVIESGAHSDNYDSIKDVVDKFVQIITFLHFSKLETVILAPNGKHGTKMSPDRWKNESKTTFIIVDSTWNKTSIRTEGFSVRGFFRLQPCGVGLWDRKIIYVDEFEKKGYVRTAKRETVIS